MSISYSAVDAAARDRSDPRVSHLRTSARRYDRFVAETTDREASAVGNASADRDLDLLLVAYASAANAPFTGQALSDLLVGARRNNARQGLTGMLLYHRESFFQVLEGPPVAVERVYDRIFADQRHTKIIKLIQEPVERRSFADWTMGLGRVNGDELGAIPGLNDFFRKGSCFWELEPGRAHTLLGAFREGRWRRTVDN
jgi:hypothetical protein